MSEFELTPLARSLKTVHFLTLHLLHLPPVYLAFSLALPEGPSVGTFRAGIFSNFPKNISVIHHPLTFILPSFSVEAREGYDIVWGELGEQGDSDRYANDAPHTASQPRNVDTTCNVGPSGIAQHISNDIPLVILINTCVCLFWPTAGPVDMAADSVSSA